MEYSLIIYIYIYILYIKILWHGGARGRAPAGQAGGRPTTVHYIRIPFLMKGSNEHAKTGTNNEKDTSTS